MRLSGPITLALVLLPVLAALPLVTAHSENAVRIEAPARDLPAPGSDGLQTAVIAGGCFWGIQAVYQHTKGVTNAVSAMRRQQGDRRLPVGELRAQHARRAVQVTYDPRVISYGKILQIFFSVAHDPTQLNRQGPDVGPQYRSEIFPQDEAQRELAAAYVAQLDTAKAYPRAIVTKINSEKVAFYPAEDYHQDYAILHPISRTSSTTTRPRWRI